MTEQAAKDENGTGAGAGVTREEAVALLTGPDGRFEVVDEVVFGVSMPVYRNAPTSMRAVFEASRLHGDLDFLVYEDQRWTFEEHYVQAAALARMFIEHDGLVKGDRVAIVMRNFPEWVITFWATQAAGLVAVPLNAWWTADELEYGLRNCGARAVVADGERLAVIRPFLDALDVTSVISVRSVAPTEGIERRWEDVLGGLDLDGSLPDIEITPDDDATILYTSGTTGRSKGAVATHRNHVTNLMNTMIGGAIRSTMAGPRPEPTEPTEPSDPPAALQTAPFFHIGGLSGLYICTSFGVRMVLMYKWDTELAFDLIERERITSFAGVPTVVRQLLEAPDLENRDLSSITSMTSGGAPVPPDLISTIDDQFVSKVAPTNGYGLTETTSAVVALSGRDYVQHPDSVGRLLPVARLRIVDPETQVDVPTGNIGEIWILGPNVVRGYWDRPEANAEAFTDGWFHSGDVGYLDDEGLLYVVDRIKDVIIRGGENIYSGEVEAALFEHPGVADVALVGTPHRALGEEAVAIVVRKPGSDVTSSDLQQHVAERLATFKVPAHVLFWDEPLPRTETGKVLKRDLRDKAVALLGSS